MPRTILVALLLSACSSPPPPMPEAPATPPVAPPPTSAAPAPTPPPTAAPTASQPASKLGYVPAWTAKGGSWNDAMVIAPSGDLVAMASSTLTVHARHDGKVLQKGDPCDVVDDGLAFRADGMLLVVCDDSVHEVKFPGLAHKQVVKLPTTSFSDEGEACAYGPGVVAIGNNQGKVWVYDTTSWKLVTTHDLGGKKGDVRSLAYSRDGKKLAVSRRDNGIVVIEDGAIKPVAGFKHASGAVAFSPDGARLFGEIEYFRSAEVSLIDGFLHNEKKVGSWLTVARYVTKDLVAASGSDGLALFAVGQAEAVKLSTNTGEGLAVSADGSMICGGTRDTKISCFVKEGTELPPSTYVIPAAPEAAPSATTPAPSATPPAPTSPPPPKPSAIEGTLSSKVGSQLVIGGDGSTLTPGAKVTVSKHIEKQLGPFKTTMWLGIAEATVTKASATQVTLRITRELSTVVLNGKRVNHFTPGARLRVQP